MPHGLYNKYRVAIEVLQRGRDALVDDLADEIVDQGDELTVATYTFNELLETQGTRLHFLGLLIGQLEQSAEAFDDAHASPPPPKPAARKRPRTKKIQQTSKEGAPEDV